MRGRTWPTSVTQPITQPSHASTQTLHSKYQGGDPTRSFLGGASTRKQARRLDHNSCPEQPPGPRGAEDVEGKVREAAATSTEEGLRPGSRVKAPLGCAKTHDSLSGRPRGHDPPALVHDNASVFRLLRALSRSLEPSTVVGRLGCVWKTLKSSPVPWGRPQR